MNRKTTNKTLLDKLYDVLRCLTGMLSYSSLYEKKKQIEKTRQKYN